MFHDVTNRLPEGKPTRGAQPGARARAADRFGGKTPPAGGCDGAARPPCEPARGGAAFGSQARFVGHGSTYAERGTAVHGPGAGAYTPRGTRTSARKKSAVRLQAVFRGAISRRMSRGLFAEQVRVARAQPGPGNYEAHALHTIARQAEPAAGEASHTSAFRDCTRRFEDGSSIYARGAAAERAPPKASASPGGRGGGGCGIARAPDSADRLRDAAQRLLRAQQGAAPPRDPAVPPRSARSARALARPAEVVTEPGAPGGADGGGAGTRALGAIEEARPEPARELAGALAGLGLRAADASDRKKVRFSVGITVGAYEPLVVGGGRGASPVVSEGGARGDVGRGAPRARERGRSARAPDLTHPRPFVARHSTLIIIIINPCARRHRARRVRAARPRRRAGRGSRAAHDAALRRAELGPRLVRRACRA